MSQKKFKEAKEKKLRHKSRREQYEEDRYEKQVKYIKQHREAYLDDVDSLEE